MQQIWTNPSNQRSVQTSKIVNTNIMKVMEVTLTDPTTTASSKVLVFPNMEYRFKFYDSTYGGIRTVIALVTGIFSDQIKVKYHTPDRKCDTCPIFDCSSRQTKTQENYEAPMPMCHCVLNPPDIQKYDGPEVFFIPVANLVDVSYVKVPPKPEPHRKPGGVKVVLLGITSTTLKAIIIRLDFWDDQTSDIAKVIDIGVGGVYNFTYEKHHVIYESKAKVIGIEEELQYNEVPGSGIVRENVGAANSVYVAPTKDDFYNAPPVRTVKLIVDTSDVFDGHYEVIYLNSLRDCKEVLAAPAPFGDSDSSSDSSSSDTGSTTTDGTNTDSTTTNCTCDNCADRTEFCSPLTCGKVFPPPMPDRPIACDGTMKSIYNYKYGDGKAAILDGENVKYYDGSGNCIQLSVNDLIKFYIGIEG